MATSNLFDVGFSTQGQGGNQFFPQLPTLPSNNQPGSSGVFPMNPSFSPPSGFNPPGIVPQSPASPFMPDPSSSFAGKNITGPGMTGIGKGIFAVNPIDPQLTNNLFGWLNSQVGKGVPAFDLSTLLPSSGQATAPGQLNAPLTGLLANLQNLFMPGGSLGDMASKGVSALPVWGPMVEAMQRQIGQGAANLKEQFNVEGGLASSPFGNAMGDYFTQSNKDLNALLGNLQFQGISDQLQAAGMEGGFGQFLQGLDQQSIQNMLNEFIRTSPQYNPLLSMMFSGATTFPPTVSPNTGSGILGSLLPKLPGAAAAGIGAGQGGGAIAGLIAALGALCWIAEVIYGVDDERTHLVRKWLKNDFIKTQEGFPIVITYAQHGQAIANIAKKSPELRKALRPWFNKAVAEARRVYA